jgi:hypothetical protein
MTTSARVIRDENFGISRETLEEFRQFAKKPEITPKELAELIKSSLEEYENQRIINANNANKNFSHKPSRFSKLLNNIKHPVSSRISRLLKKLKSSFLTSENKLVVEGYSPPLSSSKGGYKKPNILKKQPKKPNILKKQPKKPNILKKQPKKPKIKALN